jgi:hypothetical protein
MRRVELSVQQEQLLNEAAAGVSAPFRHDFVKDAKSRLGHMPTNHAVMAAIKCRSTGFGRASFWRSDEPPT